MSILEQLAARQPPMIVPLSVEQYHGMLAKGILREGEAIELIDGMLVRKDRADRGGDPMAHGPRHAMSVKRLQRSLRVVENHGYHLHCQLPVTLANIQEPEPDLVVVRGREEDYEHAHPGPTVIAAIMEVSDSSLGFDRTTKQELYATVAIPVYWIVNLVDQQIEVYQNPEPAQGRYGQRMDYRAGQTVSLDLGSGVVVEVAVTAVLTAS